MIEWMIDWLTGYLAYDYWLTNKKQKNCKFSAVDTVIPPINKLKWTFLFPLGYWLIPYDLLTLSPIPCESCSPTDSFMIDYTRVVKSSRLLAKIGTYLVNIGRLLCLAFLYGWHFLNEISLDWPLTLTTQLSTSKLSDNPATQIQCSKLEIMVIGLSGVQFHL